MTFALHGNIGSVADFDFLRGLDGIHPVDLWPLSHLSLIETVSEIKTMADNYPTRGLLGYSMGGRIALQAMATAPDFWDYAIIISAHPGLKTEQERKSRRFHDRQWAELIRTAGWQEFLEQWNNQQVLSGPVSSHQLDLESKRNFIANAFENWSLGCQDNLRPRLKNFQNPVTWITGERDSKFVALGQEVSLSMKRCNLVKIPNCGHRVLLEGKEAVRRIISETDW